LVSKYFSTEYKIIPLCSLSKGEKYKVCTGVLSKETDLADCHDHRMRRNKYIIICTGPFAVLGIVCGTGTNCQNAREEDSAKSGRTQGVSPQQAEV